ncbi:MAG: hypothetical protein Q8P57_04115 [Candidatus Pacearchaeota archaeon]|nr:hypothetical protein [Candidatus Pacearchaeota archaeon]
METTIQISRELLERLKGMKIYAKESYENIIWDLVEDRLEFSKETKNNIKKSEKEIKENKTISLEIIKKRIGG